MSLGSSLQQIVIQKIDELGSDLILKDYVVSYNDYGDELLTLSGTSVIRVVPVDDFFPRNSREAYGWQQTGDVQLITDGNFIINGTGYVEYNGRDYQVADVEDIPLQNLSMAKIINLNKKGLE